MREKNLWSRALVTGTTLLLCATVVSAQDIPVTPYTLPPAGTDNMEISMIETYTINGVGTDTVNLNGTLITSRSTPLLGPGQTTQSWDTSTVISQFTTLDVNGTSSIFGPVRVTLDPARPTYAAVKAGKCGAAVNVVVSLPALGLTLTTATSMQLQSTVTTIPPIGTQQTVSVGDPTSLVDSSGRVMGTLNNAQVVWRQLDTQTPYGSTTGSPSTALAKPLPSVKTPQAETAKPGSRSKRLVPRP